MARVVIADAGPLIALARLDTLQVLAGLFGGAVAPPAVLDECMAKDTADSRRIAQAIQTNLLRIESPDLPLPELPRSLGEGEKQAIALALGHPQSLLILDDRLARRQAARMGVAFIGIARLLHIAEQRGLIASAEISVETLGKSGYRISPDVLRRVRREGEET
ncbi:MAG: DUF3368 domain-containing protein [Betaproteobacteria bacterium]|nr:DUF3368 domain-containing protein [Betaproteobacteria bacterium]